MGEQPKALLLPHTTVDMTGRRCVCRHFSGVQRTLIPGDRSGELWTYKGWNVNVMLIGNCLNPGICIFTRFKCQCRFHPPVHQASWRMSEMMSTVAPPKMSWNKQCERAEQPTVRPQICMTADTDGCRQRPGAGQVVLTSGPLALSHSHDSQCHWEPVEISSESENCWRATLSIACVKMVRQPWSSEQWNGKESACFSVCFFY